MATPGPAAAGEPTRTERMGALAGVRPPGLEERYTSLFTVGRGGMGTVEVALERGEGGFERVVALKRLLPECARDPRHKEMFLREAQLAAWLEHPNVVHAYTFGQIEDELFLVMEYVEGETLSQLLGLVRERQERLDPALVAWILAEVCDGLHAAHELRDPTGKPLHVVHRDVSPHNVMISGTGHAKILDFGVAKFEMSAGGSQTRTGEVKGKMAYMSPEQALGEKLDRRTDLFSVGAVLFECVAGRRMWGPGTDLDVMRKLALEEPPRLDAAIADAPRSLVELHARLVAREPEKRPGTAREVAERLRAIAGAELRSESASREAVRALMKRLFAIQEEARRAQLTEALERVAPAHIETLRKSLEPADSTGGAPEGRGRTWAAWAAAVVLAAAAGGVAWGKARSGPAGAGASVNTTPPAASASASAMRTVAPVATPTPTPMPTTTTTSTSTSTTGTTTRGGKGAPLRGQRTLAKPPDVDPSPF